MKFRCIAATCIALLAIIAASSVAHAVIIVSGNGNTTAPVDDPGFGNVGKSATGNASATYLGNRWAISARHVTVNNQVTFGGITYTVDNSTITPLFNSDSTIADLQLFRLTTDPGLPTLSIGTASPAVGSQVLMTGNGFDRGNQLYWNVTAGPTWTQTATPSGATDSGYDWLGSHTLRWGENIVAANGGYSNLTGFGNVHFFEDDFDHVDWTQPTGLANPGNEAIASVGDSGGGVFQKSGTWSLVGIIIARTAFENQPGGPNSETSVFGNSTLIADLTQYRSQIRAIVPEPGSFALALLGLAGLAFLARRRQLSRKC